MCRVDFFFFIQELIFRKIEFENSSIIKYVFNLDFLKNKDLSNKILFCISYLFSYVESFIDRSRISWFHLKNFQTYIKKIYILYFHFILSYRISFYSIQFYLHLELKTTLCIPYCMLLGFWYSGWRMKLNERSMIQMLGVIGLVRK